MNKFSVLTLLLFYKYLVITSANYIGDVSRESFPTESQNVVKGAYYLITTPKVWMSSEESVCLVLLREFSLPNAVVNFKILSTNSREIFSERYQPLNSLSQCVRIPIDEIRAERALLRVQLSDIIDETLEIRIKPSNGLTLIETSKPIYRTNEKLQFRVITLNDWLRPIDEQFEQISVVNSKSIPVMQWNAVNCTNGLISLEMPIAQNNILGTWKIKAITKKNVVTQKIFKVLDYETPNIVISVDSPNYIFSTDKQTVSKICVRNSFGQLLKGKLNTFVSYIKFDWERLAMLQHYTLPYDLNEIEIDGCYDLVLQSSKLRWNSVKYSQRNLKLNFQFIENSNGFVEEKFVEIPVVEKQLIISFPSVKLMKQYFKPSLPYFGYALVSLPDYSFASQEKLTVCYQTRQVPWISGTDYNCEQLVSDNDGLVHFTIPPMSKIVKQIEVRVQSNKYPTIESKIVLEPSFSPSEEYVTIRPLINRNHCEDLVEFDVLFNKPLNQQNQKIYYQIIGRGLIHEPQQYTFETSQKWVNRNSVQIETAENFDVLVSKLRVKIPQQSALNNNLINRILIFYLDSNNNLIADSNVFLTTCSDENNHSTQISLMNANNGNGVSLQLKAHQNSTCAVRVSQNKPYSSLRKINQFIERFNVQQDSSARDNCETRYNLRKTESGAPYSPYSPYAAPYGLDEVSTNYEPVLNYGDAWDSFNDIGLLVSSNTKLDESPCDWDLYPRDTLSQLRDLRTNQMKYLSRRNSRYVRNQLQDLERSLFNEILNWNVVTTDDRPIYQQISHDLVATSGQLYSDTVCLNKQFGITYARNSYARQINENSFRLSVRAPKTSRLGETIVYKVSIEKTGQQCLPIQLQFESSDVYEMVNKPRLMCICGNSSDPISLMLKTRQIGSMDVKIVATNPINFSADDMSPDCAERQSISFAPQSAIKQLTVSPLGIVSEQVNDHIICNNNDNTISEQTPEPIVHNLSHLRDSSDVIVTNELVEPMLRYIKWRVSTGNHNALDSLSAFAASYYLYNYSNNMTTNWQYKNQLMHELSKSYQSLMTYRHSDGSYSLVKSRRSLGDIGLSAAVFRVLAQSKPHLSYIESGNRINRLHHTLMWIYEQQADDGCFYSKNKKLNVWPLNFADQYELTGYVLASLLEAGLDFGSNPVVKAYQCLSSNTNSFVDNIQTHPLSAIFYTYIQILTGNIEESKVWIKALQTLNNFDESDLLNREMKSYLSLVYYMSDDLSNARRFGQQLMRGSQLWQTPISSYAITKLWPVLKIQNSNLKVYGEQEETTSTLVLNETHSHHRLVGHKIETQGNGCLLISNNQIKTSLATKSTNFKVSIEGLDRGFVTCNRRRVKLCIKENIDYKTTHPVLRMQLVTGFDVDNKLIKKMIESDIVSKYTKMNREIYLFLHPLHSNTESYCITIPLVQKEELYEPSEAFIRIYDYYNEDLNDVIPYTIPLECQIEQNIQKQVQLNQKFDE